MQRTVEQVSRKRMQQMQRHQYAMKRTFDTFVETHFQQMDSKLGESLSAWFNQIIGNQQRAEKRAPHLVDCTPVVRSLPAESVTNEEAVAPATTSPTIFRCQ